MAHELGFRTRLVAGQSDTLGRVIRIHRHQAEERQRFDCAHELGHAAAEMMGMDPESEPIANAIASALLLPDSCLKRDLSATAWDIAQLVERYRVSWEVMARRLPWVVSSVVTVIDNGRVTWRSRSPWLMGSGMPSRRKLEPWEERLVCDCQLARAHLYEANLVTAYFVGSGNWSRVVLVAGAEEWEAVTFTRAAC